MSKDLSKKQALKKMLSNETEDSGSVFRSESRASNRNERTKHRQIKAEINELRAKILENQMMQRMAHINQYPYRLEFNRL